MTTQSRDPRDAIDSSEALLTEIAPTPPAAPASENGSFESPPSSKGSYVHVEAEPKPTNDLSAEEEVVVELEKVEVQVEVQVEVGADAVEEEETATDPVEASL